jgi:hypothetical protein
MKALQEHLNKWLLLYVLLAMGIGLGMGLPAAAWTKAHQGGISTLTTVAVFLIIYPMMVNVKWGALLGRVSNWGQVWDCLPAFGKAAAQNCRAHRRQIFGALAAPAHAGAA